MSKRPKKKRILIKLIKGKREDLVKLRNFVKSHSVDAIVVGISNFSSKNLFKDVKDEINEMKKDEGRSKDIKIFFGEEDTARIFENSARFFTPSPPFPI